MPTRSKLNQEAVTAIINTIENYRKLARDSGRAISTSHDISYQEFRAILFWLNHNFRNWDLQVVNKRYMITLPI